MGLPDPLALIADARITEADKELIAGGNARRLLNIAG
jgi:predicted TIM-barrel fold metal-dependent hydrolase